MQLTELDLEDALEKCAEEAREVIKKVAASLFDLLDDETISEKTGLPLEEIQRLKTQKT